MSTSPINAAATPPAIDSGHGNHAGNTGAVTGGNSATPTSFAATLVQAVGQSSGSLSHGSHGSASSIPDGGTHSGHLPISGTGHGPGHGFQAAAMGVRAYRQQLIASNIANADTPGYKAVDIDVQEALRVAQAAAQTPLVALATTSAGHLSSQSSSATPLYPLKYQVPTQPSVDGNTVDMDVERSKMAENSLMYNFSMDRVSGHFKMMMELFQSMRP